MKGSTVNYSNLNYLALIRYGYRIGCGWYSILVKAEVELLELGYSITAVDKKEGVLSISTNTECDKLPSKVQSILYDAELASEMTCEWCGVYTVTQATIDNELCTICEGCQESVDSLAGIEKRFLRQRINELERMVLRKKLDIDVQKSQTAHYKMGFEHYKKRSESLTEEMENTHKKPNIQVITSDPKNK